jgi:hypothetical protein
MNALANLAVEQNRWLAFARRGRSPRAFDDSNEAMRLHVLRNRWADHQHREDCYWHIHPPALPPKASLRPWGIAMVRLVGGELRRAEIHWYEAHGVGRVRHKIKRFVD